jgi:kynurenine formamidase
MCLPGCMETVAQTISRRGLFKGAGTTAIVGAVSAFAAQTVQAAPVSFSKVVDLTHPLWAEFPTYFGKKQLEIEVLSVFEKDGFNMKKWHIVEHTGTHLDTPYHFSAKGPDASAIPADTLVAPLVVINIAERAAKDPDTQITPDDIKAWEAKNGALPDGAAVAMNSGWDQHVRTDKFRNADKDGGMHFPGFHPEAAAALLERKVVGIVVDTLSLDYGASKDFATHYRWLPAGRWGLEGVANLGQVPEKGATIVVGGPKIEGASGGPSRVFALI